MHSMYTLQGLRNKQTMCRIYKVEFMLRQDTLHYLTSLTLDQIMGKYAFRSRGASVARSGTQHLPVKGVGGVGRSATLNMPRGLH
jgi:hypothetical protein